MNYENQKIAEVAEVLKGRLDKLENKADILRATELRALYAEIPTLDPDERASFGQEINTLKQELEALVSQIQDIAEVVSPIVVTEWATNSEFK